MITPTSAAILPPPDVAFRDLPRFPPEKTIAQLMAEQGIVGPQSIIELAGAGADLWDDVAEFERIHELRGRDPSRRALNYGRPCALTRIPAQFRARLPQVAAAVH